jgi:hypothetical protein
MEKYTKMMDPYLLENFHKDWQMGLDFSLRMMAHIMKVILLIITLKRFKGL